MNLKCLSAQIYVHSHADHAIRIRSSSYLYGHDNEIRFLILVPYLFPLINIGSLEFNLLKLWIYVLTLFVLLEKYTALLML